MISHDMDLVAQYADRLVVMAEGRILADGPKRDVFSMHEIMDKAFLKPPQIIHLSQKLENYGIKKNLVTVDEMLACFKAGGA